MKKVWVITIGSLIVLTCVGIVVTAAAADTTKSRVTSYITRMEVVPVTDVPGHVCGLYERRGVAVFEDGEEAAYRNCGMLDLVNKSGTFQGYCILTYKDGSTIIIKNRGTLMNPEAGKFPVSEGTGSYIRGTGRFEGINGSLTFKGHYLTPYSKDTKGDMITVTTGTYTLPSR